MTGIEQDPQGGLTKEEQDVFEHMLYTISGEFEDASVALVRGTFLGVPVPLAVVAVEQEDDTTMLYPLAIVITPELCDKLQGPAGEWLPRPKEGEWVLNGGDPDA